ncbi:hypothetical protein [Methylobacterium soli]|uniref:Uncharacterized protein n=1 Tax=Methylobacterium soli TaxID=553447 RepID=A0A6L3SSX8_9HYPH|nr:hypothetical protein [Methylobacterium soli]KAB1076681.1 hypothetical protein F6X53_22585 [Methylobacterium soli]GJE45463.1 hypothetical protein AEGHOMDF_4658 [Methylobacterium soli]
MRLNPDLRTKQPESRAMTTVATASRYARRLVEVEARTTGQPVKEVAKHVAARLRQPYGSIWGLLFRAPKTVSAELLVALQEAVERQVRLEIQALENELLAVRLGALRRDDRALEEIEAGIAGLKARLAASQEVAR